MEKKTLFVAQKLTPWKGINVVSEQTGKIGLIAAPGSVGYMEVFLTYFDLKSKYPDAKSIPVKIPQDKFEEMMK